MCTCFYFVFLLLVAVSLVKCQRVSRYNRVTVASPVPFPPCYAVDIDCLRRGLRTFFFLMDAGHLGMSAIDPAILPSISVSFPTEQVDFRLRKLNVTGARWTKLIERKFNIAKAKSSVLFSSDLHVISELLVDLDGKHDPHWARITMDIQGVESNITYNWFGQRGHDAEDYIIIGQERITVRNTRTPTYFLEPVNPDSIKIDMVLQSRPAILDHLSNEITASLMHMIMDNFRLFADKIPVKFYYKYT